MHFCNTFDDNNCSVSSGFVRFRQVSFGFARFRGKGLPVNKDYMHFLIFKNEETGSPALVPKDSFPRCGK